MSQRPAKQLQVNNAHKLKENDSKQSVGIWHKAELHLSAASRPGGVPLGDLHGAVLVEVLVHVEGVPQKVGLVAPALAQALELGAVEVVCQDGLVVGVGALLYDLTGTLTRRHAGDVGEADFGNDHIDCVIC